MKISILDRYIVKELLWPFLFGITAFSAILAGSTILIPLMNDAGKYGIPLWQIMQLFLYQVPSIIVFTFPMSMLLGTIIMFGRLSSDLEIIAFRAVGINFFRLVIPVIVSGLFISLLTIMFNESIVPRSNKSFENMIATIKHSEKPTIRENINLTEYDENNLISRVINVVQVKDGIMKKITILEYLQGKLQRVIIADNGKWKAGGGWEFYDGTMHSFNPTQPKKAIVIEFEKEEINLNINPYDVNSRKRSIEEMSAKELKKQIDFKKRTGEQYKNDLVRYHLKFAVPFACLIFSILGSSVGLRPHRSNSAMGLGISLIIILIYYVLLGVGLGMVHLVPAIIAAWLPNIIVGAIGLYMLKKISRQ